MKAVACNTGTRAGWLALSLVCGMALAPSAHAQGFQPPRAPFGPGQPVGTVLSMPLPAFGPFVRENILRQKNINFLSFAQFATGDGNTQIVTASVRQRNTLAPSKDVWIPAVWLAQIKQINTNDTFIEQDTFGDGNAQVVDVVVNQSNKAVPLGTHFCLVPTWALPVVLQVNKNVTEIHQIAVGDDNTQLALVGVSQNNRMLVPTSALATIQINTNVTVINQVAIGNSNVQMAQVYVSQANL